MAMRRGANQQERFAVDLFSVSATGAVVSSPCLLYLVSLVSTAAAASTSVLIADATTSGTAAALALAVASGNINASHEISLNPPILMTAGVFASGTNLAVGSRLTVQAYAVS